MVPETKTPESLLAVGQLSAVEDRRQWQWKQQRESPLLEAIIKQWVHEDTAV
jgi:hypothetical protein